MTDISSLDRSRTSEQIVETLNTRNLVYALENGGVWSEPLPVADLAGPDSEVALTLGADGEIVAAWLNGNGEKNLYTAVWADNRWSEPVNIATGQIDDGVTVGVVTGRTTVIWTERLGTNTGGSLHSSSFDSEAGQRHPRAGFPPRRRHAWNAGHLRAVPFSVSCPSRSPHPPR